MFWTDALLQITLTNSEQWTVNSEQWTLWRQINCDLTEISIHLFWRLFSNVSINNKVSFFKLGWNIISSKLTQFSQCFHIPIVHHVTLEDIYWYRRADQRARGGITCTCRLSSNFGKRYEHCPFVWTSVSSLSSLYPKTLTLVPRLQYLFSSGHRTLLVNGHFDNNNISTEGFQYNLTFLNTRVLDMNAWKKERIKRNADNKRLFINIKQKKSILCLKHNS